VQGLQVSAPFGKVAFALQVFEGVEGIRTEGAAEVTDSADRLGFTPPWPGVPVPL
jgi:hypothetical protein